MQPPRLPQTRVLRLLLPTSLLLMAFGASATLVPRMTAQSGEHRSMIAQWVETRRVYSEEMANWKIGREMLMQRAEVYQRDIADLKARTAETSASITEADTRRTELETERDALKAASVSLVDSIAALESRTLRLLDRVLRCCLIVSGLFRPVSLNWDQTPKLVWASGSRTSWPPQRTEQSQSCHHHRNRAARL